MRVACVANGVPSIFGSGEVGLHKVGVVEISNVLVVSFLHGCMDGNPHGLDELIVNLPLINQAIDEGFSAGLGSTGAPPPSLMVWAIGQESSAIPERIEIALVVPLPTLGVWHHLTKVDDCQAGKSRSL